MAAALPDRGVFCSPDDLTTALEEWIKLWNQDARPFTWAKTAGQIIDRGTDQEITTSTV
jgi:hypothetical protein